MTKVVPRKNDLASAEACSTKFEARARKKSDTEVSELEPSNLRNILNLCRLSEACAAAGNADKARAIRNAFVRPLVRPQV